MWDQVSTRSYGAKLRSAFRRDLIRKSARSHTLPHPLRSPSQLAKFPNTQGIMPLRQPHTRLIAHQIAVKIIRHRQPQRAKQQNLPSRRLQQIRPAHHFGDPHGRVVHHHRQLISRHIVAPPNNKIPKVAPRHEPLRPKMQIRKTNLFPIRHPKPPVHPRRFCVLHICPCGDGRLGRHANRPTRPRINRLVIPLIRRTRRQPHILPRTNTWINHPPPTQRLPSPQIKLTSLALCIWSASPAAIRPFTPLNPEPTQIFKHRRNKLRTAPLRIQIFVAKKKLAMMLNRPPRRHPKRPRMPEMQQPSRRRRNPRTIELARIVR